MFENIFKIIQKLIKAVKILRNKVLFLKICNERKLSQEDIDILAAVITAESQWDDKAKGYNRNGTIDYGLCQFNDYWYWTREKVIHPSVALNDPEKSIRVFIEQYLKGRIGDWNTYSSGLYLKYL